MTLHSINSGIFELMEDLGKGLENKDNIMLGGGNPSVLEETFHFFGDTLKKIGTDRALFEKAIQNYTEPKGYPPLRKTLAHYLKEKMGWNISENNLCLTNGMQNGFYLLLNYLTANYRPNSGKKNQIYLAKLPDYIGYFNTIEEGRIVGALGKSVKTGPQRFRYEINFEQLQKDLQERERVDSISQIAALLISSPNNPTSSVLHREELESLMKLTEEFEKFLIFDHAYGKPFPNIIFEDSPTPPFTPQTIHCFSFSKLGLPGIRMGCIVAEESVIDKISVLNGIQTLSPSSFNAVFLNEVLLQKDLDGYLENSLLPFYKRRKELVEKTLLPYFEGSPVEMHEIEGGFFLWLKFSELDPMIAKDGKEIYRALQKENVIVVPGDYFFLPSNGEEGEVVPSIRVSITTEEENLLQGLKKIGEWTRRVYSLPIK